MNVGKPSRLLEGIESYSPCSVVHNDDIFGVIYKDSKGEKKCMQCREVALSSDGTLRLIRKELERRIRLIKEGLISVNEVQMIWIEAALEAIDEHLTWRNYIRKCEIIFGLGRKYPNVGKNPHYKPPHKGVEC